MTLSVTMVISDVHTHFQVINAQIIHAEKTGEIEIGRVFVLGDFGFFQDELRSYFKRDGQHFLRPVACIEGNHEDHGAVPDLAREYGDFFQYQPRGSIYRLDPWRALCIGGACYMDAAITPRGAEISAADIATSLAHQTTAVDLVFSHDCPTDIGVPGSPGMEHYGTPGEPRFEEISRHFQPRWWFFGHHHRWFQKEKEGTRYIGLPESWNGYVLLTGDGQVKMVHSRVEKETRPWWKFWRKY